MFRTLKNSILYLLSGLLLLGASSFGLNKMVCLDSGMASYSFSRPSDCCETTNPSSPILKTQCCAFTEYSIDIDDYLPVKHKKVVTACFQILFPPYPKISVVESLDKSLLPKNTSPPGTRRYHLSLLQVYRI